MTVMFQNCYDVSNMKNRRHSRNKIMIISVILLSGAMIFIGFRSIADYNDTIGSNSSSTVSTGYHANINISLQNSPRHIFIFDATQVNHKYPGGYKPFEQCPNKYCFLTNNVVYADKADAIIFSDVFASELPSSRPSNQIWILRLLESPEHTMSLKEFNEKVNYTASYRSDADFHVPYGSYINSSRIRTGLNIGFAEGKSKMAAWFVSNCFTKNNRINYARRLGEQIEVDIFGSCQGQIITKSQEPLILKQYRFYLAFENSNCKEYITEKLWRAFKYSVVPVVMGAPRKDYEKYAPPNSFIHVNDFENHVELAAYLHKVASDPVLYNSYFQWKRSSYLTDPHFHCKLCESLHNPKSKVYNDLDSFWFRPNDCEASKLVIAT